jgi:hypothetical protein
MEQSTSNVKEIRLISKGNFTFTSSNAEFSIIISKKDTNLTFTLTELGSFDSYIASITLNDLLQKPLYKACKDLDEVYNEVLDSIATADFNVSEENNSYSITFFGVLRKKILKAEIQLTLQKCEQNSLVAKFSDMVTILYQENKD